MNKFKQGDTVRVLSSHPQVATHGKTGAVLSYTPSGRFVRVYFGPGHTEQLLDSELELTHAEETK